MRQILGVRGWFSSGKCDDADFLTQHTLLQICYHMASVLKESETIIACYGVWECSGEERMDVRRRSRGERGIL